MKTKWQNILIGSIAACIAMAFFACSANAVQIRRVQSGTLYFDANDTTNTFDLTYPISDQSKTLVLIYARGYISTNNRDQNYLFTSWFQDNGTIMLDRAGATETARVDWYVLEFEDGVRVIRGMCTMKDTVTTKIIDLPPPGVDSAKTFTILQCRASYANQGYSENLFGTAEVTSPATIGINRGCYTSGVTTAQTYVYQVVEFQTDAKVQSGEATIPYNTTSPLVPVNLTNPITDFTKTFLITQFRGNNNTLDGNEAHYVVRGNIDETDAAKRRLIFSRAGTSTSNTDTVTARYFVVELTDGSSTVQKNNAASPLTFPTTAQISVPQTVIQPITTAVDITRAFPIISVSGGVVSAPLGPGNSQYDDYLDDDAVSVTIASPGNSFNINRYSSTTNIEPQSVASYVPPAASVDWFITELCPITVKTPNGGETLTVGDNYVITWAAAANVANVKIEYSDDNGAAWKTIIPIIPAGNKTYDWFVGYDYLSNLILPANEKNTNCLVRVSNAAAAAQKDVSNAVFTIMSKLKITSPDGGEIWFVGDTNRAITWNKYGNFATTIKLKYSIDAPHTIWSDITNAAALPVTPGSFTWNPIPLGAAGTTTKVRVISNSNSDVYDDSDTNLEVRGSILVTEPDGSSVWPAGYTQTIRWTLNSNSTLVDIYYSIDSGTFYTLLTPAGGTNARNIDSTHGSYIWMPPLDKASQYAQIKVVDRGDGNVNGESAVFEIAPSITITQPNGNESLFVDQTYTITWTTSSAASISTVNLYYCTDFTTSKTWKPISTVVASPGSYLWTIPDDITTYRTAGIKVQNAALGYEGIYDECNAAFTIKGWLQIIAPAAGDVIPQTQNPPFRVLWLPHGSLDTKYGQNFVMQYSTDGGVSWGAPIYEALSSSSGYVEWLSPLPGTNLGGTDSMVRVVFMAPSDIVDPSVGGKSGNFSIVNLQLISPSLNLSDVPLMWECGTTVPITWDIQGTPAWNVSVYYSKSGSQTYDLIGSVPASQRSYSWNIPADTTVFKPGDNGKNTDIKIKIVSANNPNVQSISSQPVTIKSRFKPPLVPNGGTITVGSSCNINWVTEGDVETVNVKYSTDEGLTYNGAIAVGASNAGGWTWDPVNCPVSKQIRIRAESNIYPNDIYIASAQNIDAKGQIVIDSPTSSNIGANALTAEGSHRITWVVNAGLSNIGPMDLYYAADGVNYGMAFATNVDTAINTYYNWTVPDSADTLPTHLNKIKAVDADDSNVSYETAVFDVMGRLWDGNQNHALVEPKGGEVYRVGEDIDIQWKYMGNIGVCSLYYDINAGNDGYSTLIAVNVPYDNGKDGNGICHYLWPVPNEIGNRYRIKIYADNDSSNTYANSQANFAVKGSVLLNSPGRNPASPETWYVDGTNNISWGVTGTITSVDILFDNNQGTHNFNDMVIAQGYTGASPYSWSIPASQEAVRQLVTSDKCRVRVRDSGDATVYDDSTNDFYMKPRVVLGNEITPATSWEVTGNSNQFTWTTTGSLSNLRLYSSNDGGAFWYYQTSFPASTGSYIWTNIPTANTVAHGNAVIKLVREENLVEDTAVSTFPIQATHFTIKGRINVTSPLTAQNYKVGQGGNIIWNVQGDVGNLDLRYNTNAPGYPDGSWAPITGAAGIPSDYCVTNPAGYVFNVPNQTSPNVKLRLYETAHTEVFGPPLAGSPVHKILGNILFDKPSAQNPNAEDQVLTVGTQHLIQWSLSGAFTTLRASYKKAGDALWTPIGGDLEGTATQVYYTPSDLDITNVGGTNKVLFRVEDALNSSDVYVETRVDHANTVNGSLAALLPASPSEVTVGQTVPVKWKKYGNIGNLKLELWDELQYLNNAGGSQLPDSIASGASGESGVTYDWTVPDKIGSGHKIRMTSLTYGTIASETGEFTIKGAFSSIATPTVWYVSEDHNITWETTGTMSAVKIELIVPGAGTFPIDNNYTNGGLGLSNGVNTYTWSAVDTLQQQRSEGCKIRITSVQNPNVFIETNAFTIKPRITVTTPASAWVAGSGNNTAEWSAISAPTTNVDIILGDANAGTGYPVTLGTNIPKGSLSYTSTAQVPNTLTGSAKIRIQDHDYPSFVYGESNLFKVKGDFQITAPTSASRWKVGDTAQKITWIPRGAMDTANIYVDYNYSAPGNYILLFSGVNTALGAKDWLSSIPDQISNNVRIKITDADQESDTAVESDTFGIIAGFEFIAPLGGEVHHIDSDTNPTGYIIKWKTYGLNVAAVKLEYWNKDANSGIGAWLTIKSDVPNPNHGAAENTYVWDKNSPGAMPVNLAGNVKFRVTSSAPNQPDTTLESNTMVLCGTVQFTPSGVDADIPNASTEWETDGAAKMITWHAYGPVANVRLDYSNDSGFMYSNPIIASTAADSGAPGDNKGSYDWTIPSNPAAADLVPKIDSGKYARIKVSGNLFGVYVYDETADFIVKGRLRIVAPNSSALSAGLNCGEFNTITWERDGRIEAVNIKYATDGVTFSNVIESNRAFPNISAVQQSTTSQWKVPETPITTTYKLLVEDANYRKAGTAGTYAESADFRVKGAITIMAPATTAIWRITEQKSISWEVDHGQLDYVKIIASPSGAFGADEYNIITGLNPFNDATFDTGLLPAKVGSGHYDWTIPDSTSLLNTVRFKVVQDNENFTDVKSTQSAAMDIRGIINVQTPTLDWKKGDTDKTVTFTPLGAGLGTVYIFLYDPDSGLEYQLDGGSGIATIGSGNAQVFNVPLVPDAKSLNCVVRVRDTTVRTSARVEGVSGPFKCYPVILNVAITPTSPFNAAGGWTAGTLNEVEAHQVTWSIPSTRILAVRIYLSYDGGNTWPVELANNVPAAAAMPYTIPNTLLDTLSQNAKIKVADNDALYTGLVTGISTSFKITGGLVLTQPASGADWESGILQQVKWTPYGSMGGNVDLYYKYDGGAYTLSPVASAPASGGACPWLVPDHISENVYVMIKDALRPNDTFAESQVFSIMARFDITFPENGTPVYAENPMDILWNKYNITTLTHVKLEYSIDNGGQWYVITDGIPDYQGGPDDLALNSGSCTWTPASNLLTTGGIIRISDPDNPDSVTQGTGVFPIYGTIDVTSPKEQGGNPILWDVGTENTISWTFKGDIPYVTIWYSTTGDLGPWTQIITTPSPYAAEDGAPAAKTGSYAWTIPADTVLSNDVYIKVARSDQPSIIYGLSDRLKFKGHVGLDRPNRVNFPSTDSIYRVYGGDAPQFCYIDWTTYGNIANVTVKYTTNGVDWIFIDTVPRTTATDYNWAIPGANPDIIGTGRKIKVCDASSEFDTYAISEPFEIKGEISVNAPSAAGGETFTIKQNANIQWTPYGNFPGNQVLILGSTDNFDPANPQNTFEIALRPAGPNGVPQVYTWNVYDVMPGSDPVPISGTVKIRVQDNNDSVVKDTSGNIRTKGALRITPAQVWYVDDTNRSISWDYDGPIQKVDIYIRDANDVNWIPITPVAGVDCAPKSFGGFSVPDAISNTSKLRIKDHDDPTGTVESISGNFIVRGRLAFQASKPAEGQVFVVGAEQPGNDNTIFWTMNGTFIYVEIRYSTDDGFAFPDTNIIAVAHPANTPFVWNPVRDDMSQTVKFKVIDERDPANVYAISPRVNIAGSITITNIADYADPVKVPVKVGDTFSIYWSKTGLGLANVDIIYSTDGGATFPNSIATGWIASNSPYAWVVKDTDPLSPNAVIKVADHSNPTAAFDISPSFHLQGILEWDALDPDGNPGGKVWAVGNDYLFKWKKTGLINKADIYYTTDGSTWLDLPEGGNPPTGLPNTGNYTWNIPDTAGIISDTVKIRIIDHNDSTNVLESGVFKIRGYLNVIAPAQGNEWYADSSQLIKWEKRGQQLQYVNIYSLYSLDGVIWTNYLDNKLNSTPVDASQGAAGYPWQVRLGAGNDITPYTKIRIVSTQDGTTYEESGVFKVKGLIEIVPPDQHPLAGEQWVSGDVKTISWTKHGNIPAVKIEYSRTGQNADYVYAQQGSDYVTADSFDWTVPGGILSNMVKVRISNTADPAEKPTTPAISGAFRIMPRLTITAPVLNEIVPVNLASDDDAKKYKIMWDVDGMVSKVKLQYSYSGGAFITITGADNLNAETAPGLGKGEFIWRVPNNINNDVYVRISDNDAGQSDIMDDSDKFAIAGSLTFNTANGLPNAVYSVDEQAAINWTMRGSINYVKLQYCTNGTDFNYTIAPNAAYPDGYPAGLQTYLWTIPDPDHFSAEVKLKISDNDAAAKTIGDESDSTFEIRGAIDVLSPAPPPNPIVWLVDMPETLSWRIHGSIAAVKVEYSQTGLDGDYVLVPGGVSVAGDTAPTGDGIGELQWTPLGQAVGTNVRVRITSIADGNVKAVSSPFTVRGGFRFKPENNDAPLARARWPVKSYQEIKWTTFGNIQAVRVWYTADGTNPETASWTELTPVTGISNTSSLVWPGNVPEYVNSKKARIKVADANDLAAKEYSELFTIHDVIYLDRPNGTDAPADAKIMFVGTSEDIKWHTESTFGGVTKVKIDYVTDGGVGGWLNAIPIIAQTDNDGLYQWSPIPSAIGDRVRVRVMDALVDDQVFDVSENDIAIRAKFNITQPNNLTTLYSEDGDDGSVKIQWTTNPSNMADVPKVDLYYTTDGISWTQVLDQVAPIEPAPYDNDGVFEWKVPKVMKTNIARIRIFDARYTDSYGESQQFSIKGKLIVDYPAGGSIFRCGTAENLRWTTKGIIPTVGVEYIYDGTPYSIGGSHLNENNLDWTPQNFKSKAVAIRVYDITDPAVQGTSQIFWVLPNITVVRPDATDVWRYNTQNDITWNTSGPIAAVDIDYSKDAMAAWVTPKLASSYNLAANGNIYRWTIPDAVSGNCYVRVADTTSLNDNGTPGNLNDDYYETSGISGKFRIRASLELISPNIGTTVYVGDPLDIQWRQYGSTARVYIYYKSDADGQMRPILENFETPNDGIIAAPAPQGEIYTYTWTVPDFIKNDVRAGIADPNDDISITKDESDVVFAINPKITVILPYRTGPGDYSKWDIGSTQAIRWNWTGTVYDVNILYSLNGGVEWKGITAVHGLAGDPDKEAAYSWYINPVLPDLIPSKDFLIKVADARPFVFAEGVSGQSSLLADFTLTSIPVGTEFTVNDPYTILWSCVGNEPYVKLDYSTDGGATFLPEHLIAAAAQNNGSYLLNMPDDITRQMRIRVRSSVDDDAYDTMTNDFRVKGAIQITSPVSGSNWGVEQTYGIGQPQPRTPGITWNTTGTIPNVMITYSIFNTATQTQGSFNPILESDGVPNDGIVTNTGNHDWTVPDEITPNAIIKVQDVRDLALPVGNQTDVFDESGGFHMVGWFRFIGFKNPADGQLIPMNDNRTPADPSDDYYKLSVNSAYDIAWRWGGTVDKAKVTYSTNGTQGSFNPILENDGVPNDGVVLNGSGSGGAQSEHIYMWTVPDTISPDCRIRITDPGDSSVYDESGKFKIQGAFTLISPITMCDNGTPSDPADDYVDYRWITDEVHDIIWSASGTINSVDLYYSKDNFADSNGDGVPDNQIPMKDKNGVNALGVNMESLRSGSNFVYEWQVPDDRSENISIRMYDSADHEVYAEGPKPLGGHDKMEIGYATITFDLRDLTTNQPIQGLNVTGTDGWTSTGIASPKPHDIPASPAGSNWEATFTHDSYGTITVPYLVGWDNDNKKWMRERTIYRTMETLVIHIWRAYSEFSYDAGADRLDMTSWLERDGSLVPGALIVDINIYDGAAKIMRKTIMINDSDNKFYYYENILDEFDVPGGVKLWVGDRLGSARIIQDVINDAAAYKVGDAPIPANFTGFFGQSWSGTSYTMGTVNYNKLQAGRVYAVASYMALGSGATFKTPVSFTVTIPQAMANMETAVSRMEDTVTSVLDRPLSAVSSELQEAVAMQTGIIQSKLTEQTGIITDATNDMKDMIDQSMASFETSVSESVVLLKSSSETAGTAAALLETTAKKYSWKAVVSPDPATSGGVVTVTVQGQPGLVPLLDIYSWDNQIILNDIQLADPQSKGIYTYEFFADKRFAVGKAYTYVVVESTTGGFATGSGMVESVSLTTIAGLAAAAPEAERASKKALEAIKAVEAVLISGENINIALTLKNLKESVDALPSTMAKESPSARMTQTINEISDRLKRLAGEEGYDFSTILETAISESPTVKEIRSKADSINEVVDILQQIFEMKFGGKEAPFISTSLQPGSVKFRIAAVNPSKTRAQKIMIKYYLPVEAKPKDVANAGGLSLEYDTEKSIYYVYKANLQLAPAEVRVFNVEVEDVWVVPESDLVDLRGRVDSIFAKLEKTEYHARAKEIADTIYPRLDEIKRTQADETVSRETHIGVYRQNLEITAKIKEDIESMENILGTAGGQAAPEILAKGIKANAPTKTVTWFLIFAIIIFIGLFTVVFFFTWLGQARIAKETLLESKQSAFPEEKEEQTPKDAGVGEV